MTESTFLLKNIGNINKKKEPLKWLNELLRLSLARMIQGSRCHPGAIKGRGGRRWFADAEPGWRGAPRGRSSWFLGGWRFSTSLSAKLGGATARKGRQLPPHPSHLPVPGALTQTLGLSGMIFVKAELRGETVPGRPGSELIRSALSFSFLFNCSLEVEVLA